MKSTFKALFLALTMALFVLPAVSTNAADINNIPAPDYTLKYTVDKSDTFIFSYNVKDFGAVSDGVTAGLRYCSPLRSRARSRCAGTGPNGCGAPRARHSGVPPPTMTAAAASRSGPLSGWVPMSLCREWALPCRKNPSSACGCSTASACPACPAPLSR